MNPIMLQAIEDLVRKKTGKPNFVVGDPPPGDDGGDRGAGVWFFWYPGWANGNFDFPRAPDLTKTIEGALLIQWIQRTDFQSGQGFSLCFTYGAHGDPSWKLEASGPFSPRWTDGGEFLSMHTIGAIKNPKDLTPEELRRGKDYNPTEGEREAINADRLEDVSDDALLWTIANTQNPKEAEK